MKISEVKAFLDAIDPTGKSSVRSTPSDTTGEAGPVITVHRGNLLIGEINVRTYTVRTF